MSVLHLACENGFDDIVQLLLLRDEIDVNIKTILFCYYLNKISI